MNWHAQPAQERTCVAWVDVDAGGYPIECGAFADSEDAWGNPTCELHAEGVLNRIDVNEKEVA